MSFNWNRRIARVCVQGAFAVFGFVGAIAHATGDVNSIVSAKVDPIPLYTSSDGGNAVKRVPASGLPWPIKDTRNDFFRVAIDGKDYWVDSMDVHAGMSVVAPCSRGAGGGPTAADFGSNTNRCR
jgi:hypothetical protein